MTSLRRFTRAVGYVALAACLALPLLVLAQGALPDPAASDAFLETLLAAIAKGDWRYVAVLAVIFLTYAIRRWGPSIPRVGAYLTSSRAGAITALVLALVTGLAPPILGWVPWSARIVADVLLSGFAAIGGWVGVRRVIGAAPPVVQAVPPPVA